ncbi:hypothetical protein [Sediminispirochaeta bajacaliforniensis]|uniref:hypothetical protein n=1 Tax=Sediminispirochaeta bajacaliforniensis TaxID=148 RepID=UPI0012B559A2|nr:hypothetical protein [Sediminispirochaeta bajacaliforniensis]
MIVWYTSDKGQVLLFYHQDSEHYPRVKETEGVGGPRRGAEDGSEAYPGVDWPVHSGARATPRRKKGKALVRAVWTVVWLRI